MLTGAITFALVVMAALAVIDGLIDFARHMRATNPVPPPDGPRGRHASGPAVIPPRPRSLAGGDGGSASTGAHP